MRTQILIEGNFLELTQEESLEITKNIDDVKDIGSRNSGFTRTIKIQGTQGNNFIFGHIFDVNVYNTHDAGLANVGYNFNAAKNADCSILLDGVEVIRGTARILEVVVRGNLVTYEVAVVGELGGLVLTLGDQELKDLDFSEHDHILNATTIQDSWTAAPGTGYYYPLIDYGYTTDGISFPLGSIRPALHVREYLDKMIKAAGYNWSSDFFDTERAKKLIIPNNADGFYASPQYSFYVYSNTPLSWGPGENIKDVPYYAETGIQYMDTTLTGSLVENIRTNWTHRITAEINFTVVRGATLGIRRFVVLYIRRTSATLGNQDFLVKQVEVPQLTTMTQTLTGSANIELADGDTIEVLVNIPDGADMTSRTVNSMVFYGAGTPTLKIPIQSGDLMQMTEAIPVGVLQKDFLIGITRMFNLYITEDPESPRRLVFKPYPDFYQAQTEAVDWTYKVDHGQDITIKPLGELTSRYYQFAYKKDGDYYNDLYEKKYGRVYGTRIFDSGVEYIQETKKIDVVFSPSPGVDVQNKGRIMPAIFKLNGTTVEPVGSNIRILYRSLEPITTTTWYIKEGVTTLATLTEYPYCGMVDRPAVLDTDTDGPYDLCFGAPEQIYWSMNQYPSLNLFSEFWEDYIYNISDKDSKLVSAYILLTPADINTLDFSRLVWIGGQVFKLNKVEDFNNLDNRPTKCELLNIIYGTG